MMEPIIQINLKTIIDNYQKIKDYTNKNIIVVIKDNAYGHGLIKVGQVLSSINAYMLAVSALSEAIALRKSMIFSPILLLGRSDESAILYSFKITSTVVSLTHLKTLANSNYPLSIHLEIDTGMNRLGIQESEIEEALRIIKKSKLKLKGVYTHFCTSDNREQNQRFINILQYFSDYKNLIIHAQASSYINQNYNEYNAVRVGLSLYGYSSILNVKPALTLKVPVINCHFVKQGTPVGYDHIEKTNEDGYIITIPWGYSLGLSRLKKIQIKNQSLTLMQIGKPCMDMMMLFSSSPLPEGLYLELIGPQNISTLLSGSDEIIYYVLSSLSNNLQRVYRSFDKSED